MNKPLLRAWGWTVNLARLRGRGGEHADTGLGAPAHRDAQQEKKRKFCPRLSPLAFCHGENSSPAESGRMEGFCAARSKGGSAEDTQPDIFGLIRMLNGSADACLEIVGILRVMRG